MQSIIIMESSQKQRSTEYGGLGQSGYTAGRVGGDPSLDLETQYHTYPKDTDERVLERGDERFIGIGGAHERT